MTSSATRALRTKTLREQNHRKDIDGLRAIAVLAVIANHFWKPLLPGGYLGVDIFFAISGFVITGSLLSRRTQSLTTFLSDFYERRLRRIIPALVFCIVITTLVAGLFISPSDAIYQNAWRTGAWALLGGSNIFLGYRSEDYFASSAELNPFTQTWSLGVEEQFYFIYPLIFFAVAKATKSPDRLRRNLGITIAGACSLSLIGYLWTGLYSSWPYYFAPLRFWEIAAGCITCCLKPTLSLFSRKILSTATLLGAGACLTGIIIGKEASALPTILTVLGTSILLGCLHSHHFIYSILSSKYLEPVGLASYSLYLWHWSVLSISRWTFGISLFTAPILILAIATVSYISYKYIENPFRRQPWFGRKSNTAWLSLASVLSSSLILINLGDGRISPWYIGKSCKPSPNNTCVPKDSPHPPVTPYISKTDITRENCFQEARISGLSQALLSRCVAIKDESLPTLYVVGDSFAAALSPAVEPLYQQGKFNIAYLASPGCHLDTYGSKSRYSGCLDFSKERMRYLESHSRAGDIILVSALPARYSSGFFRTLVDLKKSLNGSGATILVQQVMPKIRQDIADICYQARQAFTSANPQLRHCGKEFSISLDQYLNKTEDRRKKLLAISDNKILRVWDPNNLLCDQNVCRTHRDRIRLYRDSNHLSVEGARLISESLEQALEYSGNSAPSSGTDRP